MVYSLKAAKPKPFHGLTECAQSVAVSWRYDHPSGPARQLGRAPPLRGRFLARDLVERIENTAARLAAVEAGLGLTTDDAGRELQALSDRLTVLERRLGLSP